MARNPVLDCLSCGGPIDPPIQDDSSVPQDAGRRTAARQAGQQQLITLISTTNNKETHLMSLTNTIKKLTGNLDAARDTAFEAMGAGKTAHLMAETALANALGLYGERLVDAGDDTAKRTALDAQIAQLRREEEQSRVALSALTARYGVAKAAADSQDLDKRWDACEAALKARGEALEELTKLATALGKAQLKAQKAAQHAYDCLPVRTISPPNAAPYTFDRQFTDLSGQVALIVAAASHDPESGAASSAAWTYSQQPPLLQQHIEAAALWLSARNAPSFNNAA